MAVFSKPFRLAFSCYDVGHTWCPSCTEAALQVGVGSFVESLKIYAIVYFVTGLLQKKRIDMGSVRNLLQSSLFLSFNAFSFICFFCISRRVSGGLTVLSSSFIPALMASLMAIFIEKRSRQKLLSMYVANVATETFLKMLQNRGWNIPAPQSQWWSLIFAGAVSVSVYMQRTGLMPKGVLAYLLSLAKGCSPLERGSASLSEEASSSPGSGGSSSRRNSLLACGNRVLSRGSLQEQGSGGVHEFQRRAKVIRYCLEGFLKPLGYATALSAVLRLISSPRQAVKSPVLTLKRILLNPETYKLGLFAGSFSGIYRTVSSLLTAWKGPSVANEVAAGFFAGSSMLFYPSTSIVIYVLFRVLDGLAVRGIEADLLPSMPGFVPLLYAFSTALLLHAAVLEPHNLKPSYWRFLNRLTKGMVGRMNRVLIDPLGFKSSSLKPDFWPKYDEQHMSAALRKYLATGVIPVC